MDLDYAVGVKDFILWQKLKHMFVAKDEQREHAGVEAALVVEVRNQVQTNEAESAKKKPNEDTENQSADLPDLNAALKKNIAPLLRADGLTGSGRNFRKVNADWILVINIESSRAGNGFAMNIGLHPSAFPDVLGKPVDPKKLKVQLCEFRTRLPSENKQTWWQFEADEMALAQAIQAASQTYLQTCRAQLRLLSSESSALLKAKVDDFSKGDFDFSPFQRADARVALLIARLHQHHGRSKEALAFAHYGLRHVGNSVGLRRDFEALLNESSELHDKLN